MGDIRKRIRGAGSRVVAQVDVVRGEPATTLLLIASAGVNVIGLDRHVAANLPCDSDGRLPTVCDVRDIRRRGQFCGSA